MCHKLPPLCTINIPTALRFLPVQLMEQPITQLQKWNIAAAHSLQWLTLRGIDKQIAWESPSSIHKITSQSYHLFSTFWISEKYDRYHFYHQSHDILYIIMKARLCNTGKKVLMWQNLMASSFISNKLILKSCQMLVGLLLLYQIHVYFCTNVKKIENSTSLLCV